VSQLSEFDQILAATLANTTAHVMVDIETFGTGPAAIPISIGAVRFDPTKDEDVEQCEKFYVAINPKSANILGLQADMDTILWWMHGDRREPLAHWLSQPRHGLHEALDGFSQWYGGKSLPTWCKGASFDHVILATAYRVCGMTRPWHFSQERDSRTLGKLMPADWGPPPMKEGPESLKHDALYDAMWQTHELLHIRRALDVPLR
jgi:hypothetical protein